MRRQGYEGTRQFAARGVPSGAARRLTIEMLALPEGAFVLCRATRNVEAPRIASDAALASLAAALSLPGIMILGDRWANHPVMAAGTTLALDRWPPPLPWSPARPRSRTRS